MRYFIIFYSFSTPNGNGRGVASVQTINFLNYTETRKWIAKEAGKIPEQICIEGFNEITKEEYEQWSK